MTIKELKVLIKEIEKIEAVNYAEIDHANELLRISVKPFKLTSLNYGLKEIKAKHSIADELVYNTAYSTNVSRIVIYDYKPVTFPFPLGR